jgi:hypothetical protein
MARKWRRRMRRSVTWCVIAVLIGGMTFGVRAEGERDVSASPRVRSSNRAIATLLGEASARSSTFRGLVRTIEQTDGIVYVEPGRCLHSVRACLSLSIAGAGHYRILRVLVDLAADAMELMATIGHELRHAVEILTEPEVRSTTDAYLYYARVAPTTRDVFETPAAIAAGLAVERELHLARR